MSINKDQVKILKSLADETRLAMLQKLLHVDEMACQELMAEFSLSQPTLSHHFNKLVEAGVIKNRKEGTLWFYSLDKKSLAKKGINLAKFLER